MKTKITYFILGLLLALSINVFAEGGIYQLKQVFYPIIVDGEYLVSDKPILNYNGTTYIPLRKVVEATKAFVQWDSVNNSITIETQPKTENKPLEVTPTPTNTPIPTNTPTNTPTPVPTNTPTYTPTPSNTPTPSCTPTPDKELQYGLDFGALTAQYNTKVEEVETKRKAELQEIQNQIGIAQSSITNESIKMTTTLSLQNKIPTINSKYDSELSNLKMSYDFNVKMLKIKYGIPVY